MYTGEIRCYCDAPHCVTTGYMCKSELNACFTKVVDPLNTNSPIIHGCLDPIANAGDICSISLTATDALTEALPSTLECCHDDMCNYRGLHDLAQTRDSTGIDVSLAELNHSNTFWLDSTLGFYNYSSANIQLFSLFSSRNELSSELLHRQTSHSCPLQFFIPSFTELQFHF